MPNLQAGSRQHWAGANVLGRKVGVGQAYVWKTRGIATLIPGPNPNPDYSVKIARAGIPKSFSNGWIVERIFEYQPGEKYVTKQPSNFTEAHLKGHDLVFDTMERVLNFNHDLKGRPVNVRMERAWRADHQEWARRCWLSTPNHGGGSRNSRQNATCSTCSAPGTHAMRAMADWGSWEDYRASADLPGNRRGGLQGKHTRMLRQAAVTRLGGRAPLWAIAAALTKPRPTQPSRKTSKTPPEGTERGMSSGTLETTIIGIHRTLTELRQV